MPYPKERFCGCVPLALKNNGDITQVKWSRLDSSQRRPTLWNAP